MPLGIVSALGGPVKSVLGINEESVIAVAFGALKIRMIKGAYVRAGVLFGLITLLLWACAAPPPATDAPVRPVTAADTQSQTAIPADPEAGNDDEAIPSQLKLAVLVPLKGPDAEIGQALLNGATLAFFDAFDPNISLLPFDTQGTEDGARRAARLAVEAGAHMLIGPLRSANAKAAAEAAPNLPMISFSNDLSAASPQHFVMGIAPEQEVQRVMDYAARQYHHDIVALLPDGLYGDRVLASIGDQAVREQVTIQAFERYPADATQIFDPVRRLADYERRRRALRREVETLRALDGDIADALAEQLEEEEVIGDVDYSAVLLAEGGALLRTIAPLFPFFEVNGVQLMGTGLMNSQSLIGENSLRGAWFAAPDPAGSRALFARYEATYGTAAPRLMTLAYDAVALAAKLYRLHKPDLSTPFPSDMLTISSGFMGVDGLFRFLPDGRVERALAILRVARGGFVVQDPAPTTFRVFGGPGLAE